MSDCEFDLIGGATARELPSPTRGDPATVAIPPASKPSDVAA